MQLLVKDDDKIGSRTYFSKKVSQLQERPHFVTRAQSFKFKKQSILFSSLARGVRLLTGDQPLFMLFWRWKLAEVTQAQEAQPLQVRKPPSLLSPPLTPLLSRCVF